MSETRLLNAETTYRHMDIPRGICKNQIEAVHFRCISKDLQGDMEEVAVLPSQHGSVHIPCVHIQPLRRFACYTTSC